MRFWIRHAFLVLSCVVLPLMAALFYDTQSEIRRAQQAGALAAKFAGDNLETRLTLDAHTAVSSAISLAQRIADHDLIAQLAKPKERANALASISEMLAGATPAGGFAWFVDETGAVIAESGRKTAQSGSRRIGGHPLFIDTQEGFALDATWREENGVDLVGAAPLVLKGQATGAVFIGTPLSRDLVDRIARGVNADISVVLEGQIIVSTLDSSLAQTIVDAVGSQDEPVAAGQMATPIRHEKLPFLPIFMAKDAHGTAYSSLNFRVPGAGDLRWVISAPTGALLREVPARQEIMLGGAGVCVLLALLIGMINYRTFVAPIDRITDHLSEVHFGRGEQELPESRVSKPFQRLVKLINMTVQKVPNRGFSPRADASDVPSPSPSRSDGLLRFEAISRSDPRAEPSASGSPAPAPATDLRMSKSISMSMDDIVDPPKPAREEASRRPTAKESDDSTAIAAAIASIEGRSGPSNSQPRTANMGSLAAGKMPTKVRSAADIRGVPSESISAATPFVASVPEPKPSMPPMSMSDGAVTDPGGRGRQMSRGGGSLDAGLLAGLGASAGVEDRPPLDFASADSFNPEETVVSPVTDELLRKSASRDELTSQFRIPKNGAVEQTAIASVPQNLLSQTMASAEESVDMSGLDAADHAHFKETYERFIEMRKRCGEPTGDLAFDRFLIKLAKNREGLVKKYNCRTVRFQVYEKDGKAALKATPVRAR